MRLIRHMLVAVTGHIFNDQPSPDTKHVLLKAKWAVRAVTAYASDLNSARVGVIFLFLWKL